MGIVEELELYHEGRAHDENPPGPGSGRYRWGSGEHPFQRECFGVPMIKKLYEDGYDDKGITKVFRELGYDDMEIYDKFSKYGKKDGDIAEALGITSTSLAQKISVRKNLEKHERNLKIQELAASGKYSGTQIANMLGVTEGTVRNALKMKEDTNQAKLFRVADGLQEMVDKKRYLDVGPGAADYFGTDVTESKLATAVALLEEKGYHRYMTKFQRIGGDNNNQLTMQVLCAPDVTREEFSEHRKDIQSIKDYINEDGLPATNRLGLRPPVSVDSNRIYVKYGDGEGDQNGSLRDGMIQLKRGVEDLGLGSELYAQVRIAVDGTHFLKGMAVYADPDQFPPGKDIIFNSNKPTGTPLMLDDKKAEQVFKKMENDPDNPFKAAIKVRDGKVVGQWDYEGKDGKMHQSPINIVNSEEDWEHWSRTAPAQMLVNQSLKTIKNQLDIAYETKVSQLNDIKMIENPCVRRHLLNELADACDTASFELRGAPFIDQKTFSILSVPSLKPDEVYAPMYENGTKVCAIRYPHQGIFEAVELTVNNNNKEAKSFMKGATAAIGLHPKAEKQMSGADNDGDTVTIIPMFTPNGKPINNVRTGKAVQDLIDFDVNVFKIPTDPVTGKIAESDKKKLITKSYQNKQMGVATNLLQDMKVLDAPLEEQFRAVKFCYVIIDSEKHQLDWKLARKVLGIEELRKQYQGHIDPETGKMRYGAATLITRAKSPVYRDLYNEKWSPDKATGKKLYQDKPQMKPAYEYDSNTGEWTKVGMRAKRERVPARVTVEDARDLMSGDDHKGSDREQIYAKFSNDMAALANEARRIMANTKLNKVDPAARSYYSKEVESLEEKLQEVRANSPKERLATIIYNDIVSTKRKEIKEENPNISRTDLNAELKKPKRLAAAYSRDVVGAKRPKIDITEKEWDAINANAVSGNKLQDILRKADSEKIRKQAMPKNQQALSDSQIIEIKAYLKNKWNYEDIAKKMNISISTVAKYK